MKQVMKLLALILLALTVIAPLAASKTTGSTITVNTTWNGITRQYSIYASANLPPNPAMILCLHATWPDRTGANPPARWCADQKLNANADMFGFLLVSPVSTWQKGNWFWDALGMDSLFAKPPDDAGFLRNIIQTVSAQYAVSRVFVYGVSSGAFEAHAIAANSGDLISAIAANSGMLWADVDSVPATQYPVSVLQASGSLDQTVPPCGGYKSLWGVKINLASDDETLDYWLAADGLPLPSTPVCAGGKLTPGMVGYSATAANGVMVQYVLELGEKHGLDSGFPEAAVLWLLGRGAGASPAATTTGVSSSLNPSAYGLAVGFTANVTAGSGTPTGTVQFNIDGNNFGSPVTLASGSATSGSISTLTEGMHTVTATYSGSSNFATSTGTLSGGQVVNPATAGVAVTSNNNPSTFGQSVTLTATIQGQNGNVKAKRKTRPETVTGTVAWTSNGVTISGCSSTPVTAGNPGVATCTTGSLATGTDAIVATYSGDSNHQAGTGNLSQQVNQAATTIAVTMNPPAEDFGADAPVTITAVLSWTGAGAAPTGAVTIGGNGPSSYSSTTCNAPSGTTITCMATYTPTLSDVPGSYTESATYDGDGNYSVSSGTNNFTINTATTTMAVTSSGSPSSYGQSVTFTATVEGENGNVRGKKGSPGKKVKPQQVSGGSVSWNISCSSSTSLNPTTGQATCTTLQLPVNQTAPYNLVTATYTPDGNHQGSSGSFDQEVTISATTIAVASVNPASEDYGSTAPVAISATLSWTGGGAAPTAANVTIGGSGFSGSFGSTSCSVPSSDSMNCTNTYTPSGADATGTYTFTASFSGDSNYSASSSTQTGNFTIN